MEYVIVGAIVVFVVIAVVAWKMGILQEVLNSSKAATESRLPYRKNEYLLTKAERAFYEVLVRTVKDDLVVFTKIRLYDLVWLPKGIENRIKHANKVSSKHVDFVLCSRDTLSPQLVVELNDKSHQGVRQQKRDAFVADVFKTCGLAFLPVKAQRAYDTRELAAQIKQAVDGGGGLCDGMSE